MRLLTHNLLVCNVKACVETANRSAEASSSFPLKARTAQCSCCTRCHARLNTSRYTCELQIEVAEDGMQQVESEFNAEFMARLLLKLDWAALRKTAAEVGA